MIRREKIVIGLLMISLTTVCAAQGGKKKSNARQKPNLSGTWVLDESKSKMTSGAGKITDYVLKIIHQEPEIRMSKRYKRDGKDVVIEEIHYTNGKPEYNSLRGVWDSESMTRWDGKKLVMESGTRSRGVIKVEAITEEVWVLSDDGQTLTHTVENFVQGDLMGILPKAKLVFTRQPDDKGKGTGNSTTP